MTALAHQVNQDEAVINAAFLRNHRGQVSIAFSDPAYVRADAIMVDPENYSIYALIFENQFLIGSVSDAMIAAFKDNRQALLTALRPDGRILEMHAPIKISKIKNNS